MFSSNGYVEVDTALRIRLEPDFIKYYRKLFDYSYYYTISSQLPAHSAHISVILPKVHNKVEMRDLMCYNNLKVDFEYDPTNITITRKNVWMAVKCLWAENLKRKLGIVERDFWGFHVVICNFKFNG